MTSCRLNLCPMHDPSEIGDNHVTQPADQWMRALNLEMRRFQDLTERCPHHQTWAWSTAVMDNTVTIVAAGLNA